jgi:hypothetical protein
VPPIFIVSVSFLPVITSSPRLLSEAVTCALVGRSTLIALIRSPIVSVPVDVYVVALSPALTVIVALAGIPRVCSTVPVVSGAVPVPVAGAVKEELEVEEDEEVDELLDDDAVELPDGSNTLCIAAVSWELTRFKAAPLAMLARPFAKLVSAWPITLISELSADEA